DLLGVKGLSFVHDGAPLHTGAGEKLPRDMEVPSPYLMGYMDEHIAEIKKLGPLGLLWETNRGCPYACTFCDWGAATLSKVRLFATERLLGEIEYFSKINVDFLIACDANFGIVPRDLELARALVDAKKQLGFPRMFFVNYAKNSNDRVFDITEALHGAN